jgi:hypothetical protein
MFVLYPISILARKDMDVNGLMRLSNITLKYKLKLRNKSFNGAPHFTVTVGSRTTHTPK